MVEYLRANPAYSEQLLAEVRRDGSLDELSILLRRIRSEAMMTKLRRS